MVFELSFLPFWGFALVLVAALALVSFARSDFRLDVGLDARLEWE